MATSTLAYAPLPEDLGYILATFRQDSKRLGGVRADVVEFCDPDVDDYFGDEVSDRIH